MERLCYLEKEVKFTLYKGIILTPGALRTAILLLSFEILKRVQCSHLNTLMSYQESWKFPSRRYYCGEEEGNVGKLA